MLIHAGKKPDRPFNWDNVPIRPPRSIRDIPHWENFEYGGIVGIAEIVGCVTESESPWFFGEYGFLIRNAQPLPFYPCRGQLGFFDVAYGAPEGGAG